MDPEQKLLELENIIKATEERVEEAFREYRKAEQLGDERRADRWWDRETQLRDKEKQLREEKAALQATAKRKVHSTAAPDLEGHNAPSKRGHAVKSLKPPVHLYP